MNLIMNSGQTTRVPWGSPPRPVSLIAPLMLSGYVVLKLTKFKQSFIFARVRSHNAIIMIMRVFLHIEIKVDLHKMTVAASV